MSRSDEWLPPGGEMARRIREYDWGTTPLGPIAHWPQSLRTAVDLVLASGQAMQLAWGPARTMLYNDAYAPMLGDRHPAALGVPFQAAWPDAWADVKPLVDRVFAGETVAFENMPLVLTRRGSAEDTWWNFSYSPIRDEAGRVAGLLNVPVDSTALVRAVDAERERDQASARLRQSEERQAFLLKLSDALRPLTDPVEIQYAAARLAGRHMNVSRAFYFRVRRAPDGYVHLVERDYFERLDVPSLMGDHPHSAYGPELIADLAEGRASVVPDVRAAPGVPTEALARYAAGHVRSWIAVPLIKAGEYVAGFLVMHDEPRQWLVAEIALVAEVAERTWAAVERARAETALRESEERLRMALEAGLMGTWRFDLASGEQQWSEQQFRLFGLDPNGPPPTRELFMSMVLPEDHQDVDFGPQDLLPDRGLLDSEFRIRRPDGEVRWLVAHTVVSRNGAGEPIEMIGLNWDITERRQAAEHQQLLLFELQHRVRNTLAVIRSIIRRTADATDGKEDMVMHLNGRIDSFARVQAAVTRDPGRGIDLDMLIADELRVAGAGEGPRLSISGPPISLSPKAAETLGLAIHELTTNAIKYGALTARRGRLTISWAIVPGADGEMLTFSWSEHAVPGIAGQPARRGLGTEVLTRTIPYELKASSDLQFGGDGIVYTMTAPLSQLRS